MVIKMLENIQQPMILPLTVRFVAPGTRVYTDEYDIYQHLTEWGFNHHTVYYDLGKYVRDEDRDGSHELAPTEPQGLLGAATLLVATSSEYLTRKIENNHLL